MRSFPYTASTHIDIGRQNRRLPKAVSFMFFACVFFFAAYQVATAQIVHIPDPNLRAVIEAALDKGAGEEITQTDMASLQSLQASKCRFVRLQDTGNWGDTKPVDMFTNL